MSHTIVIFELVILIVRDNLYDMQGLQMSRGPCRRYRITHNTVVHSTLKCLGYLHPSLALIGVVAGPLNICLLIYLFNKERLIYLSE